MEIRVAGHQVDTGDALRGHVSERLNAMTDKYFQRAIGANVTFGRGPHDDFSCDIVAPVAQGIVLKASNRANDAHVAFEGAADKIERQLKRYVDRQIFQCPADGGDATNPQLVFDRFGSSYDVQGSRPGDQTKGKLDMRPSKHVAVDLFNPWDAADPAVVAAKVAAGELGPTRWHRNFTNKLQGDGHVMTVRSHDEEEYEEK